MEVESTREVENEWAVFFAFRNDALALLGIEFFIYSACKLCVSFLVIISWVFVGSQSFFRMMSTLFQSVWALALLSFVSVSFAQLYFRHVTGKSWLIEE